MGGFTDPPADCWFRYLEVLFERVVDVVDACADRLQVRERHFDVVGLGSCGAGRRADVGGLRLKDGGAPDPA